MILFLLDYIFERVSLLEVFRITSTTIASVTPLKSMQGCASTQYGINLGLI